MKKITTALVGSLFGLGLTSAAVAQTTISGNLDLVYHAISSKATPDTATGMGSYRAYGQETQINLANKGKLSNGMDYAAGFSWEIDGNEALGSTGNDDSSNGRNENVYIDLFLSKDTYVSISQDHIPNSDVTMTNLVGWSYIGVQGVNNLAALYPTSFNDSGLGIGLVHNLGPTTLAVAYQPNPGKSGGASDTGHNIGSANDTADNSKVEAVLRGGLGVKGLDTLLGYTSQKGNSTSMKDEDGWRAAAKYNFGAITVAGDYIKVEGQNQRQVASPYTARTGGADEITGKSIGVSYAITPALSVGALRAKADGNLTGSVTEKVNQVAVGYNLGAVALQAQYKDGKGISGIPGEAGEGDSFHVKMSTRF